MFNYLQSFSLSHDDDDYYLDDFCHLHKFNANLISSISDYDLGGEGDLFKAPEPIITTILCGEDTILQETNFSDEDFVSSLFSEYDDSLVKETSSSPGVSNFKLPVTQDDYSIIGKESVQPQGTITKSLSSDGLDGARFRPSSMNSADRESNSVHGMRRVFSEGCIKGKLINDHNTETRMQKLSRYRDKKTKRNFSRKIKYACRKALADGQLRIKGRFAKTQEANILRK